MLQLSIGHTYKAVHPAASHAPPCKHTAAIKRCLVSLTYAWLAHTRRGRLCHGGSSKGAVAWWLPHRVLVGFVCWLLAAAGSRAGPSPQTMSWSPHARSGCRSLLQPPERAASLQHTNVTEAQQKAAVHLLLWPQAHTLCFATEPNPCCWLVTVCRVGQHTPCCHSCLDSRPWAHLLVLWPVSAQREGWSPSSSLPGHHSCTAAQHEGSLRRMACVLVLATQC